MTRTITIITLALALAIVAPGQTDRAITITAGQSVSSAVELSGVDASYRAVSTWAALIMPSAWTPARIAFQASTDGSTWYDVYDSDGARVTIAADASRWIELPMSSIWAARYLRLVSVDSSGAPVTQSAARTLRMIVK